MINDVELAAMRETSETAMPETCTVTRAGAADIDPVTGVHSGTPTTIFSGACRIRQFSNSQDAVVMVGDLDETLARYVLTVPASATGVAVDDVVTVSSTTDADLDGRTFYVSHIPKQSWLTDRRLMIEDRQR